MKYKLKSLKELFAEGAELVTSHNYLGSESHDLELKGQKIYLLNYIHQVQHSETYEEKPANYLFYKKESE